MRDSSASVSTSQARWYSPTVARPAMDGPAPVPMRKTPRSWSFVEPGAWRNAASPGHVHEGAEVEDALVEGAGALDVTDVEHRVVEPGDGHVPSWWLKPQRHYRQHS